MKKSPIFLGFLQALALSIYISLVSLLMTNGEALFGNVPNFVGGLVVIGLFVGSALVCGFIVFWQPFILFTNKKITAAVRVVAYTTAWTIAFILLALLATLIS